MRKELFFLQQEELLQEKCPCGLKIWFGMYMDGGEWNDRAASQGEVRIGPLGLLSLLENRLALTRPTVHPVHRINQYLMRLERVDCESAWFHASFAADPWSTARQLLKWRDELVEAGWRGGILSASSPRLEALAELEKVEIELYPGPSDRLRSVIACLETEASVDISSIELLEPPEMFPPVWRYIFDLLQRQGTLINYCHWADGSAESNLARVQAVMRDTLDSTSFDLQDDSLILLKGDNEWEAAEHLAMWLASCPEENDQITIICGSDTGVLDHALRRHGLPRLGRAELSQWREFQQVLPLIMANAWRPIDIRLLVELLSLTMSPLPDWVCHLLLKAIREEPGVGGRAWNQALETIATRRTMELMEKSDPEAKRKAGQMVREIQALLVEDRYDPEEGIPEAHLRSRCQKVIEWLGWRLEMEPVLAEIVGQAREIQSLSVGKRVIPRTTLERMLDTVIGSGSGVADVYEEAAPWQVVDHPGQVTDPCGALIWWGFNDPLSRGPTFWSDREQESLSAAEIHIELSGAFRRREAFAWRRGFMQAQKRFIGVYVQQMEGEETFHHPFWDVIGYTAVNADKNHREEEVLGCFIRECRSFNLQKWEFAGRSRTLHNAADEKIADRKAVYIVPARTVPRPPRLSYSQMSTLIGCPLRWAFQYYGRLRPSVSQVIPAGDQMIGSFCHRIVEELYSESGSQWIPEAATLEAERIYDLLLPSMASELLLDGSAIENIRCRAAVTRAVRQLVEAVNELGLTVEKTEAELTGRVMGIPFIGYADLLLRDRAGRSFVLDLKWSRTAKYRRAEVEEGAALQLAAYAWMLRSAVPAHDVQAGFFMLAQGQLISDSDLLAEKAVASQRTLEEVWELGVTSLKDVFDQLEKGNIEVRGISELLIQQEEGISPEKLEVRQKEKYRERGMLYQKPFCGYCDYGRLCGWSGGVS